MESRKSRNEYLKEAIINYVKSSQEVKKDVNCKLSARFDHKEVHGSHDQSGFHVERGVGVRGNESNRRRRFYFGPAKRRWGACGRGRLKSSIGNCPH